MLRRREREVFPDVDVGGDFDVLFNDDLGLGDLAEQMSFHDAIGDMSRCRGTRTSRG